MCCAADKPHPHTCPWPSARHRQGREKRWNSRRRFHQHRRRAVVSAQTPMPRRAILLGRARKRRAVAAHGGDERGVAAQRLTADRGAGEIQPIVVARLGLQGQRPPAAPGLKHVPVRSRGGPAAVAHGWSRQWWGVLAVAVPRAVASGERRSRCLGQDVPFSHVLALAPPSWP